MESRPQQSGSQEEFGNLLAAEVPGLYRYARSITTDASEAEDLVGDTVLRALERRGQFRAEASLRTWLHRILFHIAIDRSRHHAHEVPVEEIEARWSDDSYTVDAQAVVERAESVEDLRDALVHLPHHYRSAVVLHDAEGWPVREVAEMLDISLPAAKQRVRRGRMMLVSALAQGAERAAANEGVPLTCWQARQEVSDYLDHRLGDPARAALEAHLATCATCPPLYQALVGATAALGALHDPDSVVPSGLAERIREQISGPSPASAPWHR